MKQPPRIRTNRYANRHFFLEVYCEDGHRFILLILAKYCYEYWRRLY